VFIVDEVHMLTNEAFNALLKTLEEPPPKVVFIFATTEPARFLPRSCRGASISSSGASLRADRAGAQAGGAERRPRRFGAGHRTFGPACAGSLRDAFSLLDQTVAYAEGTIGRESVEQALGIISEDSLFKMTELWAERKTADAFVLLDSLWEAGIDPGEWAAAFGEHLRDLLASKVGAWLHPARASTRPPGRSNWAISCARR